MFPELGSIKRMRNELGITQSTLAELSGVSQPTIAKIEAGKLDPSYSNARILFATLESRKKGNEKKAGEFGNRKVILISKKGTVSEAIKLMRNNEISQLPVVDSRKRLVGSLSEKAILDKIEADRGFNPRRSLVSSIMEPPFPTVTSITPLSTLAHILHDSLAVIVMDSDKPVGIITKSDLIREV